MQLYYIKFKTLDFDSIRILFESGSGDVIQNGLHFDHIVYVHYLQNYVSINIGEELTLNNKN